MSFSRATVRVILYTSKTLANGEHPLMLYIFKDGSRSKKSLGISSKPECWDAKKGLPKRNHPNRDLVESIIKQKLAAYGTQVLELKSEGWDFTPDALLQKVEKPLLRVTVLTFFDQVIERLTLSKKVGNAKAYKDAKQMLEHFLEGKDILVADLDYKCLTNYETFLRQRGMLDTSLSVYFRTLRALYNAAIKEGYAREAEYPFKKFSLSRFDLTTRKRAITKEEIKKIEALELKEGFRQWRSRQLFLFSYYGQGINFIDMASLKWSDINENRLFYTRSKTGQRIHFLLSEPLLTILAYWRPQTGGNLENYIFPILNKDVHRTPTQIKNRAHKILGQTNLDLKELGAAAKLQVPLTSYVARHTFATVLKKGGVSTAIISEGMGHKSEAVTQTYLKSFENEIMDEAMKMLL